MRTADSMHAWLPVATADALLGLVEIGNTCKMLRNLDVEKLRALLQVMLGVWRQLRRCLTHGAADMLCVLLTVRVEELCCWASTKWVKKLYMGWIPALFAAV